MKKNDFLNKIGNTCHKIGFKLNKARPEILIAGGIIGVIASTVVACAATTKVSTIIEEHKETLETIHKYESDESMKEEYTEEDAQKDTFIVYAQTGVKLVKLYAPAVILGAISIASILKSNSILKKRNIGLAAAYTAVSKSFKDYRDNVIEQYGKEIDKKLKYGIKAQEIEEIVKNDDGSETLVTKTVEKPTTAPPYSRIFDANNPNFRIDDDYNRMFLKAEQNYANDLLVSRGFLSLNDVYDRLGFEKSRAGQVVGWVYNPANTKTDSYVDFGIDDFCRNEMPWLSQEQSEIMLTFNVDGYILDDPKAYRFRE